MAREVCSRRSRARGHSFAPVEASRRPPDEVEAVWLEEVRILHVYTCSGWRKRLGRGTTAVMA